MNRHNLGILSAIVVGGLTIFGQISRADDTRPALASAGTNASPRPAQPGDPVDSLVRALNLTPDQQVKLRAIFKDQREKLATLRADASLSLEIRRGKITEIHDATNAAINALLTPAQRVALEKMRQGNGADPAPAGVPSNNK